MKQLSFPNNRHNYGLDYMRIFAMLTVVAIHIPIYIDLPDFIEAIFERGRGVYIFFSLSGYLACCSYMKVTSVLSYYKNRALRILPSYYMGIIFALICNGIINEGSVKDIFHLGWIRYFLALNTVLPSNSYNDWNNIYGYWTMSCFIWFYIMLPFILKIVKSFKHACIFWIGSFFILALWKQLIYFVFSEIPNIENLSDIAGISPFGTLRFFSVGIVAYYAIRDNKLWNGIIISTIMAIIAIFIDRSSLVWACLAGILIIAFYNNGDIFNMNIIVNNVVKWFSKNSFYVYLTHLMAFDIAWYLVGKHHLSLPIKSFIWFLVAIFFIFIFSFILNSTDNIVRKIFKH